MKTILKAMVPLAILVAIHLVFAYANWQVNPGKWTETARTMAAFFMACGLALGVFISKIKHDE